MPESTPSLEGLRIDKRAKDGRGSPVWIALLLLLVAGAAAAWWWLKAPRPAEVTTATVQELGGSSGSAVLNASGYVTARRRATVSSKITGKVIEVLVEEGRSVRKGQVLARLDPTTAEKYVSLAEAELLAARRAVTENRVRLDQARITLNRTRRLAADGISNQADLDSAQSEVQALEARLALVQEQVGVSEQQVAVRRNDVADTVVTAPFDGVVTTKDAQPGEMISPVSAGGGFTRTGICTVVDMSSLEIEIDVNESFINRVTPGQRVEAALDAYPDWRIPAHVITVVPTADRQKATVLVRVGFDKLDSRMLPNMGVKVAFLGEQQPAMAAKPRLAVPRRSLRADGNTQVVFVVNMDHVERRAVRAGAVQGDMVDLLSGVAAGERVVVEGPSTLKDGDKVIVK
ncbi:MAG: efflux RND transporter periplasmic adaptor subunit [Acidobacteria bacterium]|nr:efflux RND transporter periplasmic adaptor subunit [Acidobacteriota bacterium]